MNSNRTEKKYELSNVISSKDYSTSEVFAGGKFVGEKQDAEWSSNQRRNLLKRNYVSRSKSRSTLEENSLGEETEKTNPKIQRKWKSQRKRKFKRFAVPESIENATSTINSTEDFLDAVKSDKSAFVRENVQTNNTSTKPPNEGGVSLKVTNSTNEQNNDTTNVMNLKQENKTSGKSEIEQSSEISGFRRMASLSPINLGRKIRDKVRKKVFSKPVLPEVDFTIAEKKILKDLLHQIDQHFNLSNKQKNENVSSSEKNEDKENENDESENEQETEVKKLETEKEDEEKKEEDKKEEKKEKNPKNEENVGKENVEKSEENSRGTSIVSSSDTELFQIIPDVFLPMRNNDIIEGKIFPWKALTSRKYTKEISMQEGPNKTHTTKETKSKLSFLYVNDPNTKSRDQEKLENPLKVYDFMIVSKDNDKDNNEFIKQNVFDNNDVDENNAINGMIDTTLQLLIKILHLDLF
ncbi:hypothetical protein M0802_011775 [Mischocyttarus mexicanus]|nr:hypothetical protein M0802_011775 [Mischocyttarus mexicanus]